MAPHLINKMKVGSIFDENEPQNWPLRSISNPEKAVYIEEEEWKMVERVKLNNNTFMITFERDGYLFDSGLPGIGWIAKHFLVSDGDRSRIYTPSMVAFEEVTEYRKKVLEFLEEGTEGRISLNLEAPVIKNRVRFFIRCLDRMNAFSKILRNFDLQLPYNLTGPFVSYLNLK